jgi:cell division septation protein DedD
MSEAERRRQRREISHLKNESVWLQKALFALRKAEDAREQLADLRDEKIDGYMVPVGEGEVPFEEVEEGLDQKIDALTKKVREMRRGL